MLIGYSGRHVFIVNVWGYAKIPLGCMVDVKLHISWKVNLQTAYTYDEDLGPVVQRPISTSLGLNFNLGFFISLFKNPF